MCGIAGWYRRGNRPVSKKTIVRQCNALRHRGPDDSGYFIDADVGMGMRRLSIIDVEGGHQPMALHDGRYTIVFNGEIYNHRGLRVVLEAKGYRFKTYMLADVHIGSFLGDFSEFAREAWKAALRNYCF